MKVKIIFLRRCSGADMPGEKITLREADDGRLGITALSPTEWLVCDTTIAAGDPAALVGFIQLVGGSYEVTHLGHGSDRSHHSSFRRATASLVRAALA